jgi:hypothetical protein
MPPRFIGLQLPSIVSLLLTGCGGGNLNLATAATATHDGHDYQDVYHAVTAALSALGSIENASVERGVVIGFIPPYRVKAAVEPGTASVHLEGMDLDYGAWSRSNGAWVIQLDRGEVRRKGVQTMPEAIEAWGKGIEQALRARR